MFEYLEMSNITKNGIEYCSAYENFNVDRREIWCGTKYVLRNDYNKNCWVIQRTSHIEWIGVVDKGEEETMTLCDFKKWLIDKNIKDGYMEWLRNNPDYMKHYPEICGAKFVTTEQN